MAQNRAHYLGFVDEPRGKERPQRPIDQPRNERLLLGRPALALKEAPRDLPGGERLLLVVHGQRKEVLTGFCALDRDRGAQNSGLPVSGEHGAVGLTSDLTRLQHEAATAPIQLLTINMEHSGSSFSENLGDGMVRRPERPDRQPEDQRRHSDAELSINTNGVILSRAAAMRQACRAPA